MEDFNAIWEEAEPISADEAWDLSDVGDGDEDLNTIWDQADEVENYGGVDIPKTIAETYRSAKKKGSDLLSWANEMNEVQLGKDILFDVGEGLNYDYENFIKPIATAQFNPAQAVTEIGKGLGLGFVGFMDSALTAIADEITQLASRGEIDFDETYKAMHMRDKLYEFEPEDPMAQLVLASISSIPLGIQSFADSIALAFDDPNTKAAVQTGGFLGSLFSYGKVFETLGWKKPKYDPMKNAKPGDWSMSVPKSRAQEIREAYESGQGKKSVTKVRGVIKDTRQAGETVSGGEAKPQAKSTGEKFYEDTTAPDAPIGKYEKKTPAEIRKEAEQKDMESVINRAFAEQQKKGEPLKRDEIDQILTSEKPKTPEDLGAKKTGEAEPARVTPEDIRKREEELDKGIAEANRGLKARGLDVQDLNPTAESVTKQAMNLSKKITEEDVPALEELQKAIQAKAEYYRTLYKQAKDAGDKQKAMEYIQKASDIATTGQYPREAWEAMREPWRFFPEEYTPKKGKLTYEDVLQRARDRGYIKGDDTQAKGDVIEEILKNRPPEKTVEERVQEIIPPKEDRVVDISTKDEVLENASEAVKEWIEEGGEEFAEMRRDYVRVKNKNKERFKDDPQDITDVGDMLESYATGERTAHNELRVKEPEGEIIFKITEEPPAPRRGSDMEKQLQSDMFEGFGDITIELGYDYDLFGDHALEIVNDNTGKTYYLDFSEVKKSPAKKVVSKIRKKSGEVVEKVEPEKTKSKMDLIKEAQERLKNKKTKQIKAEWVKDLVDEYRTPKVEKTLTDKEKAARDAYYETLDYMDSLESGDMKNVEWVNKEDKTLWDILDDEGGGIDPYAWAEAMQKMTDKAKELGKDLFKYMVENEKIDKRLAEKMIANYESARDKTKKTSVSKPIDFEAKRKELAPKDEKMFSKDPYFEWAKPDYVKLKLDMNGVKSSGRLTGELADAIRRNPPGKISTPEALKKYIDTNLSKLPESDRRQIQKAVEGLRPETVMFEPAPTPQAFTSKTRIEGKKLDVTPERRAELLWKEVEKGTEAQRKSRAEYIKETYGIDKYLEQVKEEIEQKQVLGVVDFLAESPAINGYLDFIEDMVFEKMVPKNTPESIWQEQIGTLKSKEDILADIENIKMTDVLRKKITDYIKEDYDASSDVEWIWGGIWDEVFQGIYPDPNFEIMNTGRQVFDALTKDIKKTTKSKATQTNLDEVKYEKGLENFYTEFKGKINKKALETQKLVDEYDGWEFEIGDRVQGKTGVWKITGKTWTRPSGGNPGGPRYIAESKQKGDLIKSHLIADKAHETMTKLSGPEPTKPKGGPLGNEGGFVDLDVFYYPIKKAADWYKDVKEGRREKVKERVGELRKEYLTPTPGNPLDKIATEYLKSGDFKDYVDNMPALGDITPAELFKVDPTTKETIANMIKVTAEGEKLRPAIRKSGFHAIKEFSVQVKGYKDISKRDTQLTDPTRMMESADQGKFGGPVQKHVLWPSRRNTLAKQKYVSDRKMEMVDITQKYDIKGKKMRVAISQLMDALGDTGRELPNDQIKKLEKVKPILGKLKQRQVDRVINAAKDISTLLDKLLSEQNQARAKRNQRLIERREGYIPYIRETNILWDKIGVRTNPKEIAETPEMPDFIHPDNPFNARALKRTSKDQYPRIEDINKLVSTYIETAGKDIFDTNTVQNNKIHASVLKNRGLPNAANAIDTWTSEVFAGVKPRLTRWFSEVIPDKPRKLALAARRNLTRAVFPLNWTWNAFIQTSSAGLTYVRYGNRAMLYGIKPFFDPVFKQAINENAYSHIMKTKRGGSMALQDVGESIFATRKLDYNFFDNVEHYLNFISTATEEALTRHAVAAAYYKGRKLGLEGRALWEYASEGGAKTQSMYNYQDIPGILRSREMGVLAPFQTFALEVFNTARELDVPLINRVIGKTGTYQTINAKSTAGKALLSKRMGHIARWAAAIMVTNSVVDKAIGRKPWEPSSFVPFFNLLVGGPYSGKGPVHQQYVEGFRKGVSDYFQYGSWKSLRKWFLQFHVIAGIQAERMIQGIETVVNDNKVTGPSGKTTFKIDDDEQLKAIMAGPYKTESGQEYLEKRKQKSLFDVMTGKDKKKKRRRANIK